MGSGVAAAREIVWLGGCQGEQRRGVKGWHGRRIYQWRRIIDLNDLCLFILIVVHEVQDQWCTFRTISSGLTSLSGTTYDQLILKSFDLLKYSLRVHHQISVKRGKFRVTLTTALAQYFGLNNTGTPHHISQHNTMDAQPRNKDQIVFKIRLTNEIRRLSVPSTISFSHLLNLIAHAFADPNLTQTHLLRYKDDEQDWVTMSSDLELREAIRIYKKDPSVPLQLQQSPSIIHLLLEPKGLKPGPLGASTLGLDAPSSLSQSQFSLPSEQSLISSIISTLEQQGYIAKKNIGLANLDQQLLALSEPDQSFQLDDIPIDALSIEARHLSPAEILNKMDIDIAGQAAQPIISQSREELKKEEEKKAEEPKKEEEKKIEEPKEEEKVEEKVEDSVEKVEEMSTHDVLAPAEEKREEEPVVPTQQIDTTYHHCDGCQLKISKDSFRYHCTECPDYDLCSGCQQLGTHNHHAFDQFHHDVVLMCIPATLQQPPFSNDFMQPPIYNQPPLTYPPQNAPATDIHMAMCDQCSARIRGARYRCSVCQDFDLCQNCRPVSQHDPTHPLLVFSTPFSAPVLEERAQENPFLPPITSNTFHFNHPIDEPRVENHHPPAPAPAMEAPDQAISAGMKQLKDMGFTNEKDNFEALIQTRGDVVQAVVHLLG
ncbi:hypothetical protein PROFUN_11569 [Planoprotostelium fungivorum]|uniref:ZZ-type zinc finger-containing protein n=1 Tax=Planoprotostelium fungivorum TaxID=1890364 RepID=A0A2P6N9K2_9EUKA|nr:hypothetical protein PROFUN_11569 [Planoprotostelium fungivorum]